MKIKNQNEKSCELVVKDFDRNDDFIKSRIFTIRGVQVVLDRDLAELYGVQTKVLNQAVKRNANRFPPEFMFALAKDETEELVTNCDRFLILDGKELYHLNAPKKRTMRFAGEIRCWRTRRALKRPRASLKNLGRQYCAVSKMDAMFIPSIMERI